MQVSLYDHDLFLQSNDFAFVTSTLAFSSIFDKVYHLLTSSLALSRVYIIS